MIRYAATPAEIDDAVSDVDPGWLTKAARRQARINAAGEFAEKTSIWSTVKPAFMKIQHNKCIFCERQLEGGEIGKIEFDLEHFRPKSSIKAWPDPTQHPHISYDFTTGSASAQGYHWLAYHLGNYAASCKPCNSPLKSNFFPIAGDRAAQGADTTDLARERPFLCYPIGSGDEDPERLVTFVATTAVPSAASGHRRRRGQIIIDFFDLNRREHLHRDRARTLVLVGPSLLRLADGTETATDRAIAAKADDPALPHAACLRALRRMIGQDPAKAERVIELCRIYAVSTTGTVPPDPATI